MVGMEDIFPHSRVYESGPAGLEEERRLCYVGMTHAQQELHLTYARSRLQFGQRAYNHVSRFIADMGDQVAAVDEPTYQADSEDYYSDELPFVVGDQVRTAAFGVGEVIEHRRTRRDAQTRRRHCQKLNTEYARLEKYDPRSAFYLSATKGPAACFAAWRSGIFTESLATLLESLCFNEYGGSVAAQECFVARW